MEGSLSAREELQMEIPYSPEVVDAFMLHTGGSILAAERALAGRGVRQCRRRLSSCLPDHGEGFCMIHDFAVAIRRMQKRGTIQRAMTIDCDVHQGNGTASIFGQPAQPVLATLPSLVAPIVAAPRRTVARHRDRMSSLSRCIRKTTTRSWKPPSSIDVNLPDGCGDDEYLAWLDNALSSGLRQFDPELICYVAGADPYREDQLGGLNLTIEGLKQRDELVFRAARSTWHSGDGDLCRRLCHPRGRHRDHSLQHHSRGGRSL